MVRVRYDRGLNFVFSHNVEKIRVARIESDGRRTPGRLAQPSQKTSTIGS